MLSITQRDLMLLKEKWNMLPPQEMVLSKYGMPTPWSLISQTELSQSWKMYGLLAFNTWPFQKDLLLQAPTEWSHFTTWAAHRLQLQLQELNSIIQTLDKPAPRSLGSQKHKQMWNDMRTQLITPIKKAINLDLLPLVLEKRKQWGRVAVAANKSAKSSKKYLLFISLH